MFPERGSLWLSCGLGFLATFGAGCRRPSSMAITPQAATPGVATTAPTTRAAGEFVRGPQRIVLDTDEVRVPIELVTYMPVLTSTSADGSRRRMILDTGADTILVTPELVAAKRLATRPSHRTFRNASGTRSAVEIAAVDKLEIGGSSFEDFDADVSPLYAGADALLGWPLWHDLLVTIDYPRRVLVLQKGGLPAPDGQSVLPLRFEHDRLMVKAMLDGRETWLNLDTGWGVGDSIELTPARAAEVAWASPAVPTMVTNAPGGVAAQKLGRLKGDLILGRYRFVQPVAGTNGGVEADILAAAALAKFSLTLDLHNMRARFDRATEEPIRPEPAFVAGFDCDLTSKPLRVIGVLPGSDAERVGLRVGDLLLTVDGRPGLDGLLSHKEGALAIELQRGEQKSTLTVPMTTLVP